MKKILFFAVAIITIVSTSCTDQQKVKTNVKRYLGRDNKVLDFTFNDNDTIYTFDGKVKLLEQINELCDELRRYHELEEEAYLRGNISLSIRYIEKSNEKLDDFRLLLDSIKNEQPVEHIVKTATVTYRDNKGQTNTEKFVISEYNTIDCQVSSLGASYDDYKQMWTVFSSKTLY